MAQPWASSFRLGLVWLLNEDNMNIYHPSTKHHKITYHYIKIPRFSGYSLKSLVLGSGLRLPNSLMILLSGTICHLVFNPFTTLGPLSHTGSERCAAESWWMRLGDVIGVHHFVAWPTSLLSAGTHHQQSSTGTRFTTSATSLGSPAWPGLGTQLFLQFWWWNNLGATCNRCTQQWFCDSSVILRCWRHVDTSITLKN